jgi:maltose alpha-D-glucosyltransferase/alpha-amylase
VATPYPLIRDPELYPRFGRRGGAGINPLHVATKQKEKKDSQAGQARSPYRPTTMPDPKSPAEDATAPTAAPQWFGADPLWFKRAVFYEIHIRGFADGNADGIGDFVGLTEKLDYLQWLGIDCIWLLPMYPSPLRDGGYDIADFYSIHPDYGTIDDFRAFIDAAHERGIRVIADLVMNHTSSDHPWFQEARSDPASPKRDWYVWSDTDERYPDARIIFLDTETSNWTWDPVAGQYFWHRFYTSQPDLNYDNPEVQDTMLDVLRFWLDLGLDGFRLDAVPYLYERDGTNGENLPETHAYLKRVRAEIDARYADRALLAEANQWPADVVHYFGDGDECHMAFQFPVMPRLFLSIRREDATPLVDIIEQTPPIPDNCQWGLFLRNHDELTLEMVTDEERDYMWAEYAQDPRMKLNLGIRRRLAPLLDNDRDVIELLTAILFSLPGSPVLYYGDEIGMGDNIYLGDRDGVRTPMQWTGDRSGGFSRADFAQLYLPPLMDPVYGFQAVNVEAQLRTSTSLLRWIHRFIALRKQHPVFALGSYETMRSDNHRVLSHIRRHEDEIVLCVHNLARSAQFVELDLSAYRGYVPEEMLGSTHFPPIGELPYLLTLGGRGFYWFRLIREDAE